MSKQTKNGNGELYTPGHCKICRDSEHGDYGNGNYTRINHLEHKGIIVVCAEHFDSEYLLILKEHNSSAREVPESEGDER